MKPFLFSLSVLLLSSFPCRSISKDFTGNIYQVCSAAQNSSNPLRDFRCKQYFNVTAQNSTVCRRDSTIAKRVVDTFRAASGCILLLIKLFDLSSGKSSYFSDRDLNGADDNCPSDHMDVQLTDECVLQLTPEEEDFRQLCRSFNISVESGNCTCDMFVIAQGTTTYKLCDVFDFAKRRPRSYGNLNINSDNANYRTILQRSCLYLNQIDDCECEGIRILKGNLTANFCSVNGLEGLCKYFRKPMNECTCSMFNFSEPHNDSVCDFLKPFEKQLVYDGNYLVPYAAVETVASVFGIFGNMLVVAIAIRFRRGLATCKRLIAHLAFNDLYFAIFQLIYAIPKFWTPHFIYGDVMCKVLKSVDYLGTFLAIGIILTISVERFIGIVNPFSRGISNKGIQGILFANVVFGVSASMPLFYYNDVDSMGVCKTIWPNEYRDSFIYNMFVLCAYLIVPAIVIATLYSLIVFTLHGTIIVGKDNFFADPRVRQKRLQENRRTMYVLVGVVVAFVLFVFPKHLITVYINRRRWNEVNNNDLSKGNFFFLLYVSNFSYPFHVAINPIIYSLIDARWRKDVRHFFKRNPWRTRSALSGTINSTLTVTQRRRSSLATILDDAANQMKRKSPPTNLKIIG